MELSTATIDAAQRTVNPNEVLKGEASIGAQNIQAVTLYTYPKSFILDPNRGTNIPKRLVIDRQTGRLSEGDLTTQIPSNFQKKIPLSAFMGTVNILDKAFLLLVEDVLPACNIEGNDVFSINSTTFIPYASETEVFNSPSGKETISYIQNLRKLLSTGYYFSYTWDLTLSKVKMATNPASDARFCWNGYMMQDLIKFKISSRWLIPMIQGYIGYFNVYMVGKKLEFFLITRRSCYKGGTRYNARGIDDEGNVANFCESEQIIYYNGYCCSFVEVRGSVPVFFQQRGMTTATKVTRSFELTNQAFLKHVGFLNEHYGRILSVNLLAKTKPGEQMITEAYETHLKNNNLPAWRYEFFDFHHACKGHKFFKVNPLVLKIQPLIEGCKFYAEDMQKKAIIMTQKGTVRTNCLDCLDRTNVFMTKVAMIVFESQMKHLGVDLKSVFGQDVLAQLDNDNVKQQHPFILQFKNVWADNGDIISQHYAGTGSVISAVTRTGKEGFFGMIDHYSKTVGRFYIGNFEDSVKQEVIDILLGQHTETVNVFGEQFEAAVKKREKEFATYDEVKVFIATWNVGGFEPSSQYDLSDLFNNFEGKGTPEIVVFGIQELVTMNAKNLVTSGTNEAAVQKWADIILANLKNYDNYLFVRERNLVGIQLFLFVKDSIRQRVQKIDTDSIKTGMAGTFGNKGSVVIKFFIDDSSFALINGHLEAGEHNNSTRLMNLIDIHERAFQEGGVGMKREEKLMNLDYKFLFGDLNFRIGYPNAEVRNLLADHPMLEAQGNEQEANEILRKLLAHDQLIASKKSNDILERYLEGDITFAPTYKYDVGSNLYDTKEQKTPSWTDRILWSTDFGNIKQHFYRRRDYRESARRPVVSMFSVEVKKIDLAKREVVIKEVYETDTQLKMAMEEEKRRGSLRDLGILELEDKESKGLSDEVIEEENQQPKA